MQSRGLFARRAVAETGDEEGGGEFVGSGYGNSVGNKGLYHPASHERPGPGISGQTRIVTATSIHNQLITLPLSIVATPCMAQGDSQVQH